MSHAFLIRCLAALGILLSLESISSAQDKDWARAMIDKEMLNINFKTVARGQDVVFRIRVTNIYKEDMQVTSLSTSCGCISWDESNVIPIVIPSGTEKVLSLRLDTIRHPGEHKDKKATIAFYEPIKGDRASATVVVEGYVRSDVVIEPGSVKFGSVDPNKGAEQRISVKYAGRNDWHLTSIKFGNPSLLSAEAIEKYRGNGMVTYEIVARLKETAPIGILRDQMVLSTDDLNNPTIPVQVEASIEPEYAVTAADFGILTPGKPKEIPIIVRYTKVPAKPFKIEKFERTRPEDTVKVKKTDDIKPVHRITLTFTPPNTPGLFEEEFFLTVSGQKDPIVFKARGKILEAPVEAETRK